MTVVGLHDFVKVSISADFKSFFADHMHRRTGVTTNSRSSSLRFDASKHLFSEGEKNVALFFSFNFKTLLASFHADEVHLGISVRAKDFGLECMRDVQRLS